jgi:hypothetical protein
LNIAVSAWMRGGGGSRAQAHEDLEFPWIFEEIKEN